MFPTINSQLKIYFPAVHSRLGRHIKGKLLCYNFEWSSVHTQDICFNKAVQQVPGTRGLTVPSAERRARGSLNGTSTWLASGLAPLATHNAKYRNNYVLCTQINHLSKSKAKSVCKAIRHKCGTAKHI